MEDVMFTAERQRKILVELRLNGKVLVNELCVKFSVSPQTIRTDLQQLEEKGLLVRTHGGAIPVVGTSYEMTSNEKEKLNAEEKVKIAQAAADMISDGETIAIDSGTTMLCLAELLSDKKNLTVITYDIRIATVLDGFSGVNVILCGGTLRKGFYCSIGYFTKNMIEQFNVDKTFIATNSVSESGNLCTPSQELTEIKKSLIKIGKKKILLCDGSKFNSASLMAFSSIYDMDSVITDEKADKKILSELKKKGIKVEKV